jgi:hypothetical protein
MPLGPAVIVFTVAITGLYVRRANRGSHVLRPAARGGDATTINIFLGAALALLASAALAAGADLGQAVKQATNWTAKTDIGAAMAAAH